MQLYYHKTDGGAEYYGINYTICPDGSKEGISPFIIRTDGDEIEILQDNMKAAGVECFVNTGDNPRIIISRRK